MAAEFIYPPGGNYSIENNNNTINVFDTLYVTYSSTWAALNLTLFCTPGTDVYTYTVNADLNPLPPNGTWTLHTINEIGLDIHHYPTRCNLELTQYGTNDNYVRGQYFWAASVSGTSTTYSPTATSAQSTSSSGSITTGTTQSSQSMGSAAATTETGIAAASQTSSSMSATATSTTDATTSSSTPGLSTGAKAGIGIGGAAAILFIAALLLIKFRIRRKSSTSTVRSADVQSADVHEEKPELSGSSNTKGGLPEFAPGNGKQELEASNRVELSSSGQQQQRYELG